MAGTVINEPLVNSFVVGVFYDNPGTANATGATAGTPGSFTPPGSEAPSNLAGMAGVTASPGTAWTVGQYVATRSQDVFWNGTAWAAGRATVLGGEVFDPSAHTVDDVKAYVTEHPDEVQAVYDAEVAGKARTSLLEWLTTS